MNRFKFTNIQQNEKAKVEDRLFKFTPPPGVKVVKGEEASPAPKTE